MGGRKLTIKEKEDRTINKIIERIKTIEKDYGIQLTRFACQRYAMKRREELKLQREIKQREIELQRLKDKAM